MFSPVRSEARRDDKESVSQVIKLKIMIDKAENRVVFAEADYEFIDILFSFLTLPLGSILRLFGEDLAQVGPLSRLYASAAKTDEKHLRTARCRTMLLSPRNAADVYCKKLKINIDPSPDLAGKFFVCDSSYYCMENENPNWSIYPNSRCLVCGSKMDNVKILEEKEEKSKSADGSNKGDGVFMKGGASSFMVTDDLQIIPASTGSLIALFRKMGVNDRNGLEERTVDIGSDEVLQLLKSTLLSKSPLTNAFLLKQGSLVKDSVIFEPKISTKREKARNSTSSSLKLLISKSKKRVLYAEAGIDVVDLLFSFLTFPIGTVIKLLDSSSRLGSFDNLYKGAKDLSIADYIKSEECKAMLVSPKLAPHFAFENHPLQVTEYPQFVSKSYRRISLAGDSDVKQGASSGDDSEETVPPAVIMDPKSPTGETGNIAGYLKGPATYMITDNLVVRPLSPTSCISILNQINVSNEDVEESVVNLGKEEALNLLRASLTSKSVLSDVFSWREPYPEVMLKV